MMVPYSKRDSGKVSQAVRNIRSATHSCVVQSGVLFISMAGAMGANFLSSLITTRVLGPSLYGDVKFIQTFWSLLTLVMMAGYHSTASFVLLQQQDQQSQREIFGTMLLGGMGIGSIVGFCCILAACPIDWVFRTNLAAVMITVSPFAVILPLQIALLLAFQSTNQIYRMALLNTLPPMLYFSSVLVLPKVWISASSILLLNLIAIWVVVLGLALSARPRFASMRKWVREIQQQHKTYGRPIYAGMLSGVATGYLNRLAISYWVDNQAVGFYSLAVTLTEPLKMIPNAVGTSSFKAFANQRRISIKLTLATIAAALLAFVTAFVILGEPLTWLYTQAFAAVSPMARTAALGAVLYGFGDFYNRFMGAHGKGVILRNTAIVVGIVNVLGFFILVPLWGVWGALAANVVVGLVYPGVMYRNYRRYIKAPVLATRQMPLPSANI